MKLLRLTSRIMAVILSLALIAPANVIIAADESVTTKITHKPDKTYYPGFRIRVTGEINDEAGVDIARCYFKAKDETEYLFVDMMPLEKSTYEGVLPAPWLGSEAVNYFLLVVNKNKKVVKTQTFEIKEEDTEEAVEWEEAKNTAQSEDKLDRVRKQLRKKLREVYDDKIDDFQRFDDEGHLAVRTDAVQAPVQATGFSDKIIITAVDSSARFGLLPAATVTAATGGISTAVILGGLAVAAAGGVAAASSSGGDSSSSSGGTGGLTDVTVSQTTITLTVFDNGAVDGDQIDLTVNGVAQLTDHVLVGPPGTAVAVTLNSGSNSVIVHADNEGTSSPNTAAMDITNVTSGTSSQSWNLMTGENATMNITAP